MTVCMTYPCRRNAGGCPVCDPPAIHPMYTPLGPVDRTMPTPPLGCICPPTSEKTCESVICPRKNHLKPASSLASYSVSSKEAK